MKRLRTALILAAATTFAGVATTLASPAAQARSAIDAIVAGKAPAGTATTSAPSTSALASSRAATTAQDTGTLSGKLECVPYAREMSGIDIHGDAYTWWKQARGHYARGHIPRVGAVMAIRPHGNSTLGHVAMVSRVVDTRTVLLSHANWSYPGQIETDVTALDVSPNNDWSEVRIWYGPSGTLGASHWPVAGFIYNARPGTYGKSRIEDEGEMRLAARTPNAKSGAGSQAADPIGAIIAGNS